jgi:hypothetical protein
MKETPYNKFVEFFDSFLNFCEQVLYSENETRLPSAQIIAEILESEFLTYPDKNKHATNLSRPKKECENPSIRNNNQKDIQSVKTLYSEYDAVSTFIRELI